MRYVRSFFFLNERNMFNIIGSDVLTASDTCDESTGNRCVQLHFGSHNGYWTHHRRRYGNRCGVSSTFDYYKLPFTNMFILSCIESTVYWRLIYFLSDVLIVIGFMSLISCKHKKVCRRHTSMLIFRRNQNKIQNKKGLIFRLTYVLSYEKSVLSFK